MIKSLLSKILNGFFFYFGWWFCMHQAVGTHPYFGSFAVAGILIYHLATSKSRLLDLCLILVLAATGTIVDTLYIQTGMITFKGGYELFPNIAPLWITSLWALYAISINHSLEWLKYSQWLAAGLGAAGAVSSYLVGIKLGAAEFLWPEIWALATIALVWGAVVPGSIWLNDWLKSRCTCLRTC